MSASHVPPCRVQSPPPNLCSFVLQTNCSSHVLCSHVVCECVCARACVWRSGGWGGWASTHLALPISDPLRTTRIRVPLTRLLECTTCTGTPYGVLHARSQVRKAKVQRCSSRGWCGTQPHASHAHHREQPRITCGVRSCTRRTCSTSHRSAATTTVTLTVSRRHLEEECGT